MKIEQQLKALQGVLRKGTKITLLEILDIVKTIMGVDMLKENTVEGLYKSCGFMVRFSEESEDAVLIEFYTQPGSTWDSFDEPLVEIRKVDLV